MKAIVIAVYIGPLPQLMPLWLRTAGRNPAVDFLVVTDQPTPPGVPGNVRFLRRDLSALRDGWSEAAGFQVALDAPYKLNDFKPLYWMLCENLQSYDYWGYCDLDLLFGDLSLVTDKCLGRYDAVLSEGHLRLLRNSPRCRDAWREIALPRRWQDILADPANFGMDEHQGINRVLLQPGRSWFADPSLIADIDPGFRQLRLLPQFKNHRTQGFFWQDGHLYREWCAGGELRLDEFAYIHLQKRKLQVDPAAFAAESFDIDQVEIRPRSGSSASCREIAARNPWHRPNAAEARIGLREWRRRALGRPQAFPRIDRPDPA